MSSHTSIIFAFFVCIVIPTLVAGFAGSTCDFNVKVNQVLHNEGFHRNITYDIVLNSNVGDNQWLYKNCIVGLDQELPRGVYSNPDELSDLRRSRRLNAIPRNRVNVELPSEQATENGVYIVGAVDESKVSLWLPVHARYHRARPGGGVARNEIPAPRVLVRCPDARLDACARASPLSFFCNGSTKDKCSWKQIPYTMTSRRLVWEVPVGDTRQYYPVAGGTAAALVGAALYLLHALHRHARAARHKTRSTM